jgi:hypothetical protein
MGFAKRSFPFALILLLLAKTSVGLGGPVDTSEVEVYYAGDLCSNLEKYKTFRQIEIESSSEDSEKPEPVLLTYEEAKRLCELSRTHTSGQDRFSVLVIDPADSKKEKWKFIFSFGPFFAFHNQTDLRLKNASTDITIEGVQPLQRTSHHHYAFWKSDTRFGQFVDEPQNKISLEVTNNKTFFGVEYSHPKILFTDNYSTPGNNSSVNIHGVFDEKPIDVKNANLGDYLFQIQTSHRNINFDVFGGKIINLLNERSKHDLELRLGLGVGIAMANGVSKQFYTDERGYKALNIVEEAGMTVYGADFSTRTGIRYTLPGDRLSVNLMHNFVYTRIDGQVGDFYARSDLLSNHLSFGVSAKLNDWKKKKPKN